jgi:hypothetical protein
MRTFLALPVLLLAAAPACAEDPLVVLAAAPSGRIKFFDGALAPLGAIAVRQHVESIAASPDGRRLYVAQSIQGTPDSVGLYAVELDSPGVCPLLSPSALFGAPAPDGRFLFTQGKTGVDVFDAASLIRLPTMKASGQYNLQPSPDGRWLLGVANSPQPSLDIFDMAAAVLVHRIPIAQGPVAGAWAGDRFYLFSYLAGGPGMLWSARPEDGQLSPVKWIGLPDLHGACNQPVLLMLAGAPNQLYLAEAFGFKVDRRSACPDLAIGGIYVIHPETGGVNQLAPGVHVNRMVVSPDGRDLYVIDSGGATPQAKPRLLHIDARTGGILHETVLEQNGLWNLALARIPSAFIPRGNARAATVYCRR